MTDTSGKPDNLKLAVIVILLTVLALSLGDALIKLFSSSLGLWQIFVLRSLVVVPILLIALAVRLSDVPVLPKAGLWTALRSFLLVAMWIAYYAALPHLQLSIAAVAYYTLPIFITLFSAIFVGEAIKVTGWVAVASGFVGIVLILRPTPGSLNVYAAFPLISAVLYALAMILTRTKCRDEHPVVLSLALNLAFILVGLFATIAGIYFGFGMQEGGFLSPEWAAIRQSEVIVVGVLAAVILIGSVGAAVAYQNGPSSIIATFDFAYVGFAAIWGFTMFNEVPDLLSILGIVLIVMAGLIAVRS